MFLKTTKENIRLTNKYNIQTNTACINHNSFIKNNVIKLITNRIKFSRIINQDNLDVIFLYCFISLEDNTIINNKINDITTLKNIIENSLNVNNKYQYIMYLIDHSKAEIPIAIQYLLNLNFLKSNHHITNVIHASIAHINDIIELSLNIKNHINTVKIDWNSQKGINTLIFSFLYAYCSKNSDKIVRIADQTNNRNKTIFKLW